MGEVDILVHHEQLPFLGAPKMAVYGWLSAQSTTVRLIL